MIFSTFCNFCLFLFLLFFPSSKSLIYKITQKINVLPYKIIRIKRTHQYCKNTIKGICKARVIVATRQIRETMIQRMMMFLFFIYNSPALNTSLEHFDNFPSCASLHYFYIITSTFITYFTTFSPIPHLRRFFFCAVINTYFKRFCFKPALGAVHINGHWSPAYTIYTPKFRIRTTARTLF